MLWLWCVVGLASAEDAAAGLLFGATGGFLADRGGCEPELPEKPVCCGPLPVAEGTVCCGPVPIATPGSLLDACCHSPLLPALAVPYRSPPPAICTAPGQTTTLTCSTKFAMCCNGVVFLKLLGLRCCPTTQFPPFKEIALWACP